MQFNEQYVLECLEKLSIGELTKEMAYKDLKEFILEVLMKNGYEVKDLNIMYACYLIYVKIIGMKDDFGYDRKRNDPKINIGISLNNFSVDESICRSLISLCIRIKSNTELIIKNSSEKKNLNNGANILYNYLETFDYLKKKLKGFE